MQALQCNKCNNDLLFYIENDNAEELVKFNITCPCSNKFHHSFLGNPKLAQNQNYWFDIEETSIKVHKRNKR